MHAVVHDAPRVRDATLTNSLKTYYVAPMLFPCRDPTDTLLEPANTALSRQRTEPSLPLSLASSLANVFDKPVEDDGPGLRRILLPAPPAKGGPAGRVGPLQRRRQRRAAIEASATTAAAHTLQRCHPSACPVRQQQEQHSHPLQQPLSSLSSSSTRGIRPHTALSHEPRQAPYARVDSGVSTESATTTSRKVATVTSPRTAAAAAAAAAAEATQTAAETPKPLAEPRSGAVKLSYRLRRRHANGPAALPTPTAVPHALNLSTLAATKKHPLEALRHLGAATFNDAPLISFLPSLDLRVPCSRSSTGTNAGAGETSGRDAVGGTAEPSRWNAFRGQDRRRRRSSRHRPDAVAVHLGDVDAHTFHVSVLAGEASPVQTVVEGYPACLWDGSEFLLLPLEDKSPIPLEALPPHLANGLRQLQQEEDSRGQSGGQTTSLSFAQESQTGMELLGMPMNFLRSANTFETANASGDEAWHADGQAPPPSSATTAAAAAAARNVIIDGPVFGCAVKGGCVLGEMDAARSVVPCWRRFCTTVALYLTLGDAGCCDTTHFPYAAVHLCTWGDLVAQPQTRIEMLASSSAVSFHTLQMARSERKTDPVPVAVLFPMTRKGVMRRPLSLTMQPFTDAEVFQLFYLQLIFRVYFDVRFPALGFRRPGQADWHVRADLIAMRTSGTHAVAFQHPLSREEWIRFPPRTRLLTLLCLKEAVVPLYATPLQLQETAVMPLFGGGSSLPCIGTLGRSVAQWAGSVEVGSPAAAMAALITLFEKMGDHHRATRAELSSTSVRRRSDDGAIPSAFLFRCGVESVGAELDRHGSTLSRFFVLPEKRGVSVAHTDAFSGGQEHRSLADFSVKRHTHSPCIPREGGVTDTTLSSAAGTPHAPALKDAALDLDASAVGDGCSGTMEDFISTTGASPTMSRSCTNNFVSTLDLSHLPTLRVPDNGEMKLETSRDLHGSTMTQGPTAAMLRDVTSTSTITRLLDCVSSYAVTAAAASASPKKSELNDATAAIVREVDFVPPLQLPSEGVKLADSHSSLRGTLSEPENPGLTVTMQNLSFVGAASPFTKQESLVTRWRYYMQSGNCAIFDGETGGIQLFDFLGRGGSGLVYRGSYGSHKLPVAVKVLIIPDGVSHEQYVRESLTDVAFYVLTNQLNDYNILYNGRAHDFIVSSVPPKGLPSADAAEARRGGDPATTKLCYLISDLMDGTIGRFLEARDKDYDPMYDQLLNSPLQAGELFQFLFNQLALKALFDWRVLDLMLNNQLRGDNVGYRYVGLPSTRAAYLRGHLEEATSLALSRKYYAGLLYAFQFSAEDSVKYLRFPAQDFAGTAAGGGGGSVDTPLRLICMIDVGQGTQPNVAELVRSNLIGETVVPSCVEDDGFGRFWPPEELYCRNVEVRGPFGKEVVAWGSKLRIASQEDAFHALHELFSRYHAMYGVESPTDKELRTYLCLSWKPSNVAELKEAFVYRAE